MVNGSGEKSDTRATLIEIGAIDQRRVKKIGVTRDREVEVFQDEYSGVIFLEDFFVGLEEYKESNYAFAPGDERKSGEETRDAQRRFDQHRHLVLGKNIVDFGCGAGYFLQLAERHAIRASGVEISDRSLLKLAEHGISGHRSIEEVSHSVDSLFLFHVLEHLPNPIETLKLLRQKLDPEQGRIVIEVPHARDFLLDYLKVKEFAVHTFWSQHLILHTRDSLRKLLVHSGYTNISIVGVQRYGLANHLGWLRFGRGGGHEGPLAFFEQGNLRANYEDALRSLDATDTLVAVASP